MAKELPYFKFEPSEYLAKDIQDCSLETQGAFINICALYWIRLGKLTYASALRRVCNDNARLMQELETSGAIKNKNGKIVINFLDDQLHEFSQISLKNKENAKKRWNKSGGKTKAMRSHSDGNAIREEKIREDKRRDNSTPPLISGKELLPFLRGNDQLKMLLSKNTRFSEAEIENRIEGFVEREALNGAKTPSQWQDYCYKSILKQKSEKQDINPMARYGG